jgi:hypothetical protein
MPQICLDQVQFAELEREHPKCFWLPDPDCRGMKHEQLQ